MMKAILCIFLAVTSFSLSSQIPDYSGKWTNVIDSIETEETITFTFDLSQEEIAVFGVITIANHEENYYGMLIGEVAVDEYGWYLYGIFCIEIEDCDSYATFACVRHGSQLTFSYVAFNDCRTEVAEVGTVFLYKVKKVKMENYKSV